MPDPKQPVLSGAQVDALREYIRAARKLARVVASGHGRAGDSLERFNEADQKLLKLIEAARSPELLSPSTATENDVRLPGSSQAAFEAERDWILKQRRRS